ncbi:pyruvate dehydrogenase (acetyl-transferring) E1 component subunit alpha [Actibacterium sp. MT2.3-13A]|uniref:pyruvate dehydrogenase (acetyl-transferring) E1 component subunit alpha n=1 Tax=Actibacterium sp. MT2.3-13A TaxID=2828332 RepID=UPI0032C24726
MGIQPCGDREGSDRYGIPFSRFLTPDGALSDAAPGFASDRGELAALYAGMLRTRAFDAKAVALQRTGRLGTYASSLGQEGVSVGLASAMRAEDVLIPSFREHGAQLWRGTRMEELLLYWGGDERGSDFAGPREDFPVCVPVGTQYPHAVGVAMAFTLRGEARCAVVVGGDGSTSRGDFHEALNMAGVWALPVVFLINNNQWAISVPREAQTAAATLAQKAIGAGLPGEQVDGCDVIAVRDAMERALARGRAGGGATVIECITYRLSDHTTADDATRYRDDTQVSPHWAEEPVTRLREHLVQAHGWTRQEEEELRAETHAAVEAAAQAYLDIAPQPVASIADYLFETLPPDLKAARDRVAEGGNG